MRSQLVRPEAVGGKAAGFALLDTLLATVLLVVGILGAASSALRSSSLQLATATYVKAHNASRDVLERLRNGDLEARFQALATEPSVVLDGMKISVTFPEDLLLGVYGKAVPATARFRDLDGDGQVDLDTSSTEKAKLLPVRITVMEGGLAVRIETLLTED